MAKVLTLLVQPGDFEFHDLNFGICDWSMHVYLPSLVNYIIRLHKLMLILEDKQKHDATYRLPAVIIKYTNILITKPLS